MPEISQEDLDALKEKAGKTDELSTTLEGVQTTLKRIEGENVKTKTRAQEAEQKLNDLEKEKVENDGDLQKRLDMEVADNAKLKGQITDAKDKTITSKLRAGIAETFPNLQKGAIDFMLQAKKHKGLLKIDNEAETVEGFKEFGEKVIEDHPFLVTKKKLKETDNLPPKDNDLDDDNLTDDQKYRKELAAAKDQTAYDAVRKKWKRD